MSELYDFNILVVEDDQKMRNALQMILNKEGYQVEALESAEEDLERFRVRTYDLLISDIKLPGLDGMELLTAIRNFNPSTSIIMITAYATVDQAVIAMKAGAEDYIFKTIQLEEIKIVVRKVRERQELIKQNRFFTNNSNENTISRTSSHPARKLRICSGRFRKSRIPSLPS
jgi:DNA-binding NtrC family response regulator